jgi:hypothetical protein
MASGVIPLTSIPSFESILSEYGLYIAAGDVQQYASRISELTRISEEQRKALQKELREIVIQGHSIQTLSKRIFNI